jgi:Chemoreceptor zinc-binding domain
MGFFSRLFRWDDTSDAPANGASQASEMVLDERTAREVMAELDIDTAISAHENWSARLLGVIRGSSTEVLEPELVCRDDRCDLGKWLHGPGRERLGQYPAFTVLVARHKYFHLQASTVLALAQAGEQDKAEEKLRSAYRHASNQVVILLKELKRGLGR